MARLSLAQIKNPSIRRQVAKKLNTAVVSSKPKTNKYGANKQTDGFASMVEKERYNILVQEQLAGNIHSLEREKKYTLVDGFTDCMGKKERAIKYTNDFYYFDNRIGKWVSEDIKSVATAKARDYHIRRKLFKVRYPTVVFREVIKQNRQFVIK